MGILQKVKIDQMLYLEAEKEFRTHTWSFDSNHEYFESWEYELLTPSELDNMPVLKMCFLFLVTRGRTNFKHTKNIKRQVGGGTIFDPP